MKRFLAILFFAFAGFTPVAIVAGVVALGYQLSAHNNGTEFPDSATGHIYPLDAQKRFSPELIVYVTHGYRLTYDIADGLFLVWLACATVFFASTIVFRLTRKNPG